MKLRRPADGILAAPCNDWDSARPAGSSKECYIRLASRRKRQAAVLLRCMSPDVAHRVSSPRRIISVAIGGVADMPRTLRRVGPMRMTRLGHRQSPNNAARAPARVL